jgi:hypothetical protein
VSPSTISVYKSCGLDRGRDSIPGTGGEGGDPRLPALCSSNPGRWSASPTDLADDQLQCGIHSMPNGHHDSWGKLGDMDNPRGVRVGLSREPGLNQSHTPDTETDSRSSPPSTVVDRPIAVLPPPHGNSVFPLAVLRAPFSSVTGWPLTG